MPQLKHASLESGLGGFDLAASLMGWENIFHVEINPFCQQILKYYWPHAKSYTDLFEFSGLPYRGKIDVLTCGFPCQPFSAAGRRKGTNDERHLWPENARVIREVRPPVVLAENVTGLLSIEGGLVFEQVCTDLEGEGYEVTPFVIPASAVNAHHRRERLFIIGFNERYGNKERLSGLAEGQSMPHPNLEGLERLWDQSEFSPYFTGSPFISANPGSGGQQGQGRDRHPDHTAAGNDGQADLAKYADWFPVAWHEAATQLCSVPYGVSTGLDLLTLPKSRWHKESLQALGNAVVPPLVLNLFRGLEQALLEYFSPK